MEEKATFKKVEILKDHILYLILMSTIPLYIVQLSGVIESIILSSYQNNSTDVFIIWSTMSFGLCLVPYYFVKKIYRPKLSELGIKKTTIKEIVIFIIAITALYAYLFSKEKTIDIILSVSLQTLGVALTEEFWARGILCYIIEKVSDKKWIVIIINSLIFTFITHMNRPFLDNLLFRLPGSICMVIVYMRSKRLSHSILVHYIYNMVGYFY